MEWVETAVVESVTVETAPVKMAEFEIVSDE